MNIELRTIHLLRMKTLTIAILLTYLAAYLAHLAFTLDGGLAFLSAVGAFVVWVFAALNAFETLTWHRRYRRVQDHLRTDRTGHVIINHPPGPRPRPQPPKGDAGLGDYNLHRHKAMLDADLAHYRALRDEGGQ